MTQTAQHTPGPWEAIPTVHSQAFSIFGRKENAEYHVGTLTGGSKTELQVLKANARLIAAAPDMLEILKEQTDAAQAVIANWIEGNLAEAVNTLKGLIEPARAVIAKTKSNEAPGRTTRIAVNRSPGGSRKTYRPIRRT